MRAQIAKVKSIGNLNDHEGEQREEARSCPPRKVQWWGCCWGGTRYEQTHLILVFDDARKESLKSFSSFTSFGTSNSLVAGTVW